MNDISGRFFIKIFRQRFVCVDSAVFAAARKRCEIAEQRLGDRPSEKEIAAALEREGQEILKAVPPDAYLTALCVEGKQMPSEGMAELIAARENSGRPKLCFAIGGSYGLSPSVKARADRKLSMSQMTFPHHLARVMLAEQLYRGFKINEGSMYHK